MWPPNTDGTSKEAQLGVAGEEDLENELDFSGAQGRVISMRLLKSNQKFLIFAL